MLFYQFILPNIKGNDSSNEKTKGEFYVIPVYQEYIDKGHFISTNIADEMWDLGTPESISFFENNYRQS